MNTGHKTLYTSNIETPLGPMISVADDNALYMLDFADEPRLDKELQRLHKRLDVTISPGETNITQSIKKELADYFSGQLTQFKTPLYLVGTDFQKSVWQALQLIPYGETRSYLDMAKSIHKPTGFRAVALANGANLIAVVIPCHRVINHNGELGGYGGGLPRKQWLLAHEQNYFSIR